MQLRQSQRGFSLIELMIALVVGLIVSGAAVALVAAIGKSNADTVRATRLTQELRATAEVIARDMRRAQSDWDPIANVSTNTTVMTTACNTVNVSTAGCVTYGYNCGSTDATAPQVFNAVGLVGTKVYLKQSPTAAPACPTAADQIISSSAVNITAMTFTKVIDPVSGLARSDDVVVSLAGQLAYQPGVTDSVTITNPTRTISQEVRIRSAAVK